MFFFIEIYQQKVLSHHDGLWFDIIIILHHRWAYVIIPLLFSLRSILLFSNSQITKLNNFPRIANFSFLIVYIFANICNTSSLSVVSAAKLMKISLEEALASSLLSIGVLDSIV